MAPVALSALLLLVLAWAEGGFAVERWGLAAILALALVVGLAAAGRAVQCPRSLLVAAGALWLLAGWTALSALWTESVSLAWEETGRTALYAAVATIPLLVDLRRREAVAMGGLLVGGIAILALAAVVAMLVEPDGWFVGGRLERPVGHASATAALFAMAFWPLVALAARPARARLLVRAGSLGLAAAALGLTWMAQSRGVVLGLVAGGVVALALGPDRLRRTWFSVVIIGLVAAASGWLLSPYDAYAAPGGELGAEDVRTAAFGLLGLGAATFVVGFGIAWVDHRGLWSRGGVARAGKLSLAGVIAVAAVVAALAVGNPVDFVDERIDEFTRLEDTSASSTRLASVGGQRQDLWRIALLEFNDHPVTGAGAGSYAVRYYSERRSERNTSDPHSLPLRLMAETGAVGLLVFAVFLAALVTACARQWRGAPPGKRRFASSMLAAGSVSLAHSTVEWLWLLPGVMGLGILSVMLGAASLGTDRTARVVPGRLALAIAASCLLVVMAVLHVADFHVRSARMLGESDPRAQLDAANDAARLNPWSMTARYIQASALETLGREELAREQLREAIEREPRNFVTFALLGDLETRAGRAPAARRLYRRAVRLNPRDAGLRQLARLPPP